MDYPIGTLAPLSKENDGVTGSQNHAFHGSLLEFCTRAPRTLATNTAPNRGALTKQVAHANAEISDRVVESITYEKKRARDLGKCETP